MGIHGVIELCGHCDPGVMAAGHFLAVQLLKDGGEGPCFLFCVLRQWAVLCAWLCSIALRHFALRTP